MNFLVYSDIHHDYYSNGLTINDTIAVEDEITKFAVDNNIKYIFFLGDWYRATNPLQHVIKAAESSWKRRSDTGVITIALVGNHDRETKSAISSHAFVAAEIFKKDLECIKVYDTPQKTTIDFGDNKKANILYIPAGHEASSIDCSNDSLPLIVLFHGLLAGSALANGGHAGSGISPSLLNNFGASLILGGDNHTNQRLDHLLKCESFYVGAPLQHNWGDRGQVRGFMHFNMYDFDDDKPIWNWELIPSKSPRFLRMNIEARSEMEVLMQISNNITKNDGTGLDGNPGILEITLIGRKSGDIRKEFIEDNIRNMCDIRNIKIIVDRTFDRIEVAEGLATASTPEDKWNLYVAGGKAPGMEGLDPSILAETGNWAIQEAKKMV